MKLNYTDFIHPEDEAARQNLEGVMGFQTVTKAFLELGVEKLLHGLYMAEKIRLSPTQLPDIYNKLPPICKKFGIDEPEFYLEMNPMPNAYTTGDKQTFLVVTSGLLEHLSDEEVQSVLAHECGHILCRHVFYHTMANLLVVCADALDLLGKLVIPVSLALKYWSRKSELSADRAEVVYMGTSKPAINALVRLSGGPHRLTGKVNIEEYARQATAYEECQANSKWERILQTLAVMNNDHPFSAVRVKELLKWEQSEQYSILHTAMTLEESNRTCSACGRKIDPDCQFCRFCGAKQ